MKCADFAEYNLFVQTKFLSNFEINRIKRGNIEHLLVLLLSNFPEQIYIRNI